MVNTPALVVLLAVAVTLTPAQSPTVTPFTRPATAEAEAALALTALPEPMRATATVHVLGPKGYQRQREGTSGVNCLVERERPDTQEPICWDTEGSETIMPVVLARAEWRAQGLGEDTIARQIADGFASGRFRAPRRSGVAYMLSTDNYVHNGQKVVRYVPHVMLYAPYLTNRDIGGTGRDPNAPWVLNEGRPHAYIVVPTVHR